MAEGTSYTIDIDAPAQNAEQAAAIVDTLAAKLKAASEAASEAANAVKAGESAYKQSEAAADRAAKALEKINAEMATASGSRLEKLVARQAEAAKKAQEATTAMNAQAVALDKLKAAAGGAAAAEEKLGNRLEAAKKDLAFREAQRGTGNLGKLSGALGQLGGPLGAAGNKAVGFADTLANLSETVGKAGPYIALAVAIVAITTAMVSATVAATAWAISMAGAARSQMLLSDGIAGSVEHGRDLDAAIKKLERRVPQTSDELRGMAAELAKTGLKGKELADKLEETAEEAARLKYGPNFAKGANTVDKIVARTKKNIQDLFAGPKIQGALDGFLDKLADLAALFDENSVTGRAMKVVIEDIFGNLIEGATALIPKVIAGFIQLQIWILKALIAIKPYGSEIMAVVGALAAFAAVVVGVVVGAIAFGTAILVAFIALPRLLGDAFTWAGEKIVGFGKTVVDFFGSLDLASIGTSIVQGLITGILGMGPALISSLTGVVDGAISAAKGALGIASPSKVFAEIGASTGEGMAQGVEASTGGVQGALEAMVSPPAEAASAAPTASSGGGGGASVTGNTFVFHGVQGAEDAVSRIEELLLRIREGDLAQLGGAVPA